MHSYHSSLSIIDLHIYICVVSCMYYYYINTTTCYIFLCIITHKYNISLVLCSTKMGTFVNTSYRNPALVYLLVYVIISCLYSYTWGRPATFQQDFRVTWSESHIRQINGGQAIQLVLDQNSGT